jgi:hypothetical protein
MSTPTASGRLWYCLSAIEALRIAGHSLLVDVRSACCGEDIFTIRYGDTLSRFTLHSHLFGV